MPYRIDDDKAPEIEGEVLRPESLVEDRERKKHVWAAIGCLSPEHREIVILVHFEERSYSDVAELLEIPIGTVMSRLYYARRKLADMLGGVLDNEG